MRKVLRQYFQSTGIRVVLALMVFLLSMWLMRGPVLSGSAVYALPYVLVGIPMIVLAAIIAAPSITRDLVEWVVDFFTYSEKFDRAPPMYSIPQGLRKNRRYEEAMAAYEEIAEAYPDELKPWLEMIDIALFDLKDADRAEIIHQRGMQTLVDEKQLERLARHLTGLRLNG